MKTLIAKNGMGFELLVKITEFRKINTDGEFTIPVQKIGDEKNSFILDMNGEFIFHRLLKNKAKFLDEKSYIDNDYIHFITKKKGEKRENGKTFIFEGGSVKDLQEFLENCSLNENAKISKFSIFVPETEQEKKDRILKEELLLLSKKFNVSLEDIVKKIGEAK